MSWKKQFQKILFGIGGLAITATATAAPIPINMELYPPGLIIDDEFTGQYGITISADGGSDLALLYDTTGLILPGDDSDLEGPPWASGNAQFLIAGNALIVQNSGDTPTASEIAAGIISTTTPNDQPGFELYLDYDLPQVAMAYEWADLDDDTDADIIFENTVTMQTVTVNFSEFTTMGSIFFDASIGFGNNSYDIVEQLTVAELTTFGRAEGDLGPMETLASFNRITFDSSTSGGLSFLVTESLNQGYVGDLVFNDLNGNGTFEVGEPGIENVTIELFIDTNGNGTLEPGEITNPPFRFMSTLSDGSYEFPGLPLDDYIVRVTDDLNVITGTITTGSEVLAVDLVATPNFDTADFGYDEPDGSIGDLVFNDKNNNGSFDGMDVGIELISVDLYRDRSGAGGMGAADQMFDPGTPMVPIDQFIGRIFTDSAGLYQFLGLANDDYVVVVSDINNILEGSLTTANEPSFIALGVNENRLDVDFGYNEPTGSIGDTVFNDLDGNGTQNGSELGLPGVTVNLYRNLNNNSELDGSDLLIDTFVTDGSGNYLFEGLEESPSNYIVEVVVSTVPLNSPMATGAGNPRITPLGVGQNLDTIDFGFTGFSSIGQFVFDDLNNNGVRDMGEPGIPNATVDLFFDQNDNGVLEATDPRIAVDVTDGSGQYLFEGLSTGRYFVASTDRNFVILGPLTTSANPLTVNLGVVDVLDADFGYGRLGEIGDQVFNDVNGNGDQNVGEIGIPGVTIELIRDTNGNGTIEGGEPVVRTTTSDADGSYRFTGLIDDDYIVRVTDTDNVIVGTQTTPGGVDPIIPVALGPGEINNDADFGFDQGTGSIGDAVYYDNNGNGSFDGGDAGIPNVTVTLYVDVDNSGNLNGADQVVETVTTDGSGNYSFDNLGPNNYLVDVTDTNNAITGVLTSPASEPVAVVLAAAQTLDNIDFGYQETGTLGGIVYQDTNTNGTFENGETPIQNATVDLYSDDNGDGIVNGPDAVVATVTTGPDGRYEFSNVVPDDYTIQISDNNNVISGTLTGGQTAVRSEALSAGQTIDNINFGYDQANGSIGDTVFNDLNSNGIENGSDPGIQGITVELYRDNNLNGSVDAGDDFLGTQTTDSDGNYDFTGLGIGTYLVTVTDDNNLLDGAVTTIGGETMTIPLLIPGSDIDIADFGYSQSTGSIGDSVFDDTDRDGERDGGETGYENVGVELYRDDNMNGVRDGGDTLILTQFTDSSGNYEFDNLPPATYFVVVNDSNNVLSGLITTNYAPEATVQLGTNENSTNVDFGYTDCMEAGVAADVIVSFDYQIIMPIDFESDEATEALAAFGSTVLSNNPPAVLNPTGSGIANLAVQSDGGTIGFNNFTQNLGPLAAGNYTLQLGGFLNERTSTNEVSEVFYDNVVITVGGVTVRSDNFAGGVPGSYSFSEDVYENGPNGQASGNVEGGALRIQLGEGSAGGSTENVNGAWSTTITVPVSGPTAIGDGSEIGDRVWNDLNLSGTQDPNEPGIPNVTVDLYIDENDNGSIDGGDTLVGTRTTGPDGLYLFQCLDADDYLVTVTDTNNATAGLFLVNTVLPTPISVGVSDSNLTADFGYGQNPVLFVELDHFDVVLTKGDQYAMVVWSTSLEVDSVGFHIYEATLDGSTIVPGQRMTQFIIPAEGKSFDYSFLDTNALSPRDWRGYYLEEIDLSGKRTMYGPVFADTSKLFGDTRVEGFELFEY